MCFTHHFIYNFERKDNPFMAYERVKIQTDTIILQIRIFSYLGSASST